MSIEQTVAHLVSRLAEEIQVEIQAPLQQRLEEAQGRIAELEAELQRQREAAETAVRELIGLRHAHQAVLEELVLEREARTAADRQVETIHAAITEQLVRAEAEHQREEEVLLERERRWSEQIEALQAALCQERSLRGGLQQRVEALRSAAADLFALELRLPQMRPELAMVGVAIPDTVNGLLAGGVAPA